MADYTAIPSTAVESGAAVTTQTMTRLRDNPIAIAEGAAGAPRIQTEAIQDEAVTLDKLQTFFQGALIIGNGSNRPEGIFAGTSGEVLVGNGTTAVSRTLTGDVTLSSFGITTIGASKVHISNLSTGYQLVTMVDQHAINLPFTQVVLSGGQYTFMPRLSIKGDNAGDGSAVDLGVNVELRRYVARGTTSHSLISTINIHSIENHSVVSEAQADFRYMTNSPPHDLGDGEIVSFPYALMSADGKLSAVSFSTDPPWIQNGPTATEWTSKNKKGNQFRKVAKSFDKETGEIEYEEKSISELKHADMDLIPHPFTNKPDDANVILLDTLEDDKLDSLARIGESVASLLKDGYIKIDNGKLSNRKVPQGVSVHPWKWKKTK